MILTDINILIYAHRADTQLHRPIHSWLKSIIDTDQTYAVSNHILSGFIRIVTHPKIFKQPSTIDDALAFAAVLVEQPNCIRIEPGNRHWKIFDHLCRSVSAKGNIVPDAFFAALAIEHGCEWITTDRDFSRFPDLNWRHPLT